MVNVKDNALIHIAALLNPSITSERILAFAYPYNWNDILSILRTLFPHRKLPADIADAPRDLSKLDNSRGAEMLKAFGRPGFTGLEESIKENAKGL